jgi:hypothetical protein
MYSAYSGTWKGSFQFSLSKSSIPGGGPLADNTGVEYTDVLLCKLDLKFFTSTPALLVLLYEADDDVLSVLTIFIFPSCDSDIVLFFFERKKK